MGGFIQLTILLFPNHDKLLEDYDEISQFKFSEALRCDAMLIKGTITVCVLSCVTLYKFWHRLNKYFTYLETAMESLCRWIHVTPFWIYISYLRLGKRSVMGLFYVFILLFLAKLVLFIFRKYVNYAEIQSPFILPCSSFSFCPLKYIMYTWWFPWLLLQTLFDRAAEIVARDLFYSALIGFIFQMWWWGNCKIII